MGGVWIVPSNLRRSKKQNKRGIEIGKNLDSLGAVLRDYVRIGHWNLISHSSFKSENKRQTKSYYAEGVERKGEIVPDLYF